MTSSKPKRLYLLRHALASWPSTGAKDFDRPLDPSGFSIIDELAQTMVEQKEIPEAVLCSSSLRTRQTLEHLQQYWPEAPLVEFSDRLYSGNASDYLQSIQDFGYLYEELNSFMVIGHNPSIEDLTFALTSEQSGSAFERLRAGFPTAGLAVLELTKSFGDLGPRGAKLLTFPSLS
ncbi:SixA phosphatase family protein [Brucellaceae bacterium C25G]